MQQKLGKGYLACSELKKTFYSRTPCMYNGLLFEQLFLAHGVCDKEGARGIRFVQFSTARIQGR